MSEADTKKSRSLFAEAARDAREGITSGALSNAEVRYDESLGEYRLVIEVRYERGVQ